MRGCAGIRDLLIPAHYIRGDAGAAKKLLIKAWSYGIVFRRLGARTSKLKFGKSYEAKN